MESKIENKIDMLNVTQTILAKQDTLINSKPAFKAAWLLYKGYLVEIGLVGIQTEIVIHQYTSEKVKARLILADIAVFVIKAVESYAHATNNPSLKQSVHQSHWKLMKMRDERLLNVTGLIYNIADNILSNLADYDVDPSVMLSFQNAIGLFAEKSPEPREATEVKKTNNAKIKDLTSQATDLLRGEIDNYVANLPDTYDDFKKTYTSGRIIVDRHGKHRNPTPVNGIGSLYGNVTFSYDLSPNEGVLIHVIGTTLTAYTDDEGDFLLQVIPVGTYSVEFVQATCITRQLDNIEIFPDLEIELNASLDSEV